MAIATKKLEMMLMLTCEPLEQRKLLAGNVNVELTGGGDLIVEGDNEDNRIVMESAAHDPNLFTIRGESGTAINGVTNGSFTALGLSDDVRIDLRDGSNRIEIDGSSENTSSLPGNLRINLGSSSGQSGSNQVKVRRLLVEGDLRVRSGAGRDGFNFLQTNFTGRMRLDSGAGDDDVTIEGLNGPDPDAGERIDYRMGAGNDYAFLRYAGLETANLRMDAGDDYIEIYDVDIDRVNVRMGDGEDELDVGSTSNSTNRIGRFSANTGSDDDQVELLDSIFDRVDINSGEGNDEMLVDNIEVSNRLRAQTADGVDVVELREATFEFDLRLGSGDDRAILRSSTSGDSSINGNGGFDYLTASSSELPELRSVEGSFISGGGI